MTQPTRTREHEIREMLVDLFRQHKQRLKGHRVVLFGSRAQERAHLRSDFDLGVVGDEPLPLEDFFALEEALDALPTLYRFDWVDMARADEDFRPSALQHAEVLFDA
jgi:predicted nucleotidyltransferase